MSKVQHVHTGTGDEGTRFVFCAYHHYYVTTLRPLRARLLNMASTSDWLTSTRPRAQQYSVSTRTLAVILQFTFFLQDLALSVCCDQT